MEGQISASAEAMQAWLETVEDTAIFALSAGGRVNAWTDAARRVLLYTADEVTEWPLARFHTAESAAAGDPARLLAQARTQGRAEDKGWRVRRDGSLFYARTVVTAIGASGARHEPGGYAVVYHDITVQYAAEEHARVVEARWRDLLDTLDDCAICELGAEGEIRSWNRGAQALFGYTAQEAVGRPLSMLFAHQGVMPDEAGGGASGPIGINGPIGMDGVSAVRAHGSWSGEVRLQRQDGSVLRCHVRQMLLRDAGDAVSGVLWTACDVSDAARLADLENAGRRVQAFLAILAHELRNPLAPISAAAQLLKMAAHKPEYIRRSSEIIDRQVKHMSSLVNDLMDVSRVTRGLVSIDKEEVSISAVVSNAVEQSRPLIDGRKHELAVDMREDGGIVLGYDSRLVQVVVNLLNNSAKYTPQGGRIVLKVVVHDGQVEISVSDNGIGMDANLLPHVFELFTQAERTPDRSEGGLGLGLALVKSVVSLHNGHIIATSEGRGKGSTFTVTLPLLRQDNPSIARPLHILMVGRADESDAALPAALRAEGHMVALCPDEASALARAEELHPDAVLIRTDLPEVEGYALARQLRALHPDEHATYIALNDSGQSHDKVIARDAGFDHQLERPVALASLKRVLPAASQ